MRGFKLSTLLVVMVCGIVLAKGAAAEQPALAPDQFADLHRMIKRQPGENRFWEIPWLLSAWEARQRAAAEGKPIYVWSGSQGAPIGGC